MDLDETVLNNSQYQVEISRKGETFNMKSWAKWVNRSEASPCLEQKNLLI